MTFYNNSLTTQTSNAVTWARARIDATHMNTSSGSDNSSVDAEVQDGNYNLLCGADWFNQGGETTGVAVCMNLLGNECDSSDVSVDSSWMTDSGTSTSSERSNVLHELLHTVGLSHHTDPKFADDVMWWADNGQMYIGPHNVEHINGYY